MVGALLAVCPRHLPRNFQSRTPVLEAPGVGWMKGYRLLLDPLWSEERNGGVSSLWREVAWRVDIDLGSRSHQKMESVDYVTMPPGEWGSGFWTECVLTVTSSSQFSQNLCQIPIVCQASGSWEGEASRPLGDCEMV